MKFFAGVIVTVLVVLAIGGFIFATGRFNVAANAPADFTEKLAPWVLDKALERRAREVTDPIAKDPGAVARGLSEYREDCLPCHGAPGVDAAEFQEGMNPTPPGIDADVVRNLSDAKLFWVIKNGIRMTGMPAFGVNTKDDEIRDIVAFVRHVPQLTDAERNALKTGAGLEKDERGEAGAQPHSQSSVSPAASPAPVPSASPQHRRN